MPFRFGTMPEDLPLTLDAALHRLPEGDPTWVRGLALSAVLAGADGREPDVDPTSARAVAAALVLGDPELIRRVQHLRLIALRGQDFIEQRAATARDILTLTNLATPLTLIADLHLANYARDWVRQGARRKAHLAEEAVRRGQPVPIVRKIP